MKTEKTRQKTTENVGSPTQNVPKIPTKSRKKTLPSYRIHAASGQARVTIAGKTYYLGKFETDASRAEYNRLMAEYIATGEVNSPNCPDSRTVVEIVVAFLSDLDARLQRGSLSKKERTAFTRSLGPATELYGSTDATKFGPLALIACRDTFLRDGICRSKINTHVGRIVRCFRWAVSREMLPASVWESLRSVEGLRHGDAHDPPPITPANLNHVAAIEPHVSPQIWAMVRLQLFCGCRPGEVAGMRPCDIDRSTDVWQFRPPTHKTKYRGKDRVIYLGPRSQEVLAPWLDRKADSYLFSPAESATWWKSKLSEQFYKPGNYRRPKKLKRKPRRAPGARYTTSSYDRAVSRGCERAKVPSWSPNQLRHRAATTIRAEASLEAARIILGHSSASVTEIYAERDVAAAMDTARRLG